MQAKNQIGVSFLIVECFDFFLVYTFLSVIERNACAFQLDRWINRHDHFFEISFPYFSFCPVVLKFSFWIKRRLESQSFKSFWAHVWLVFRNYETQLSERDVVFLTCRFLTNTTEMRRPPYYTNYSRSRLVIHNIVTSKYFDLAIAAVIGLNVVTMAMEFYLMPPVSFLNSPIWLPT